MKKKALFWETHGSSDWGQKLARGIKLIFTKGGGLLKKWTFLTFFDEICYVSRVVALGHQNPHGSNLGFSGGVVKNVSFFEKKSIFCTFGVSGPRAYHFF